MGPGGQGSIARFHDGGWRLVNFMHACRMATVLGPPVRARTCPPECARSQLLAAAAEGGGGREGKAAETAVAEQQTAVEGEPLLRASWAYDMWGLVRTHTPIVVAGRASPSRWSHHLVSIGVCRAWYCWSWPQPGRGWT